MTDERFDKELEIIKRLRKVQDILREIRELNVSEPFDEDLHEWIDDIETGIIALNESGEWQTQQ